jgi:hypothetical protein
MKSRSGPHLVYGYVTFSSMVSVMLQQGAAVAFGSLTGVGSETGIFVAILLGSRVAAISCGSSGRRSYCLLMLCLSHPLKVARQRRDAVMSVKIVFCIAG